MTALVTIPLLEILLLLGREGCPLRLGNLPTTLVLEEVAEAITDGADVDVIGLEPGGIATMPTICGDVIVHCSES